MIHMGRLLALTDDCSIARGIEVDLDGSVGVEVSALSRVWRRADLAPGERHKAEEDEEEATGEHHGSSPK